MKVRPILLIVVSVAIIATAAVLVLTNLGFNQPRDGFEAKTEKEGISVIILESKDYNKVAIPRAKSDNYSEYLLISPKEENGYIRVYRLRVSSNASEPYVILRLILVTDRQNISEYFRMECSVERIRGSLEEVSNVIRDSVELNVYAMRLLGYVESPKELFVFPGETLEYHALFCAPRGETPQRILIALRTIEDERMLILEVDLKQTGR